MKSFFLLIFCFCILETFGQNSVIISNSENNYVFKGINNVVKFSEIKAKNVMVEGVNCILTQDSLMKFSKLYLSPTNNDSCFVIFRDSVTKKEITSFSFIVKDFPNSVLCIGDVENSGRINKEELSKGINIKNPIAKYFEIDSKIIEFNIKGGGKVYNETGYKFSEHALKFIDDLKKGDLFTVTVKYVTNSNVFFGLGFWEKNY